MHPDQIATFLDLAETLSFHATAERMGLTQSTVSARIAALEGSLGVRLFSRSRAGARLTTEGLKFAPHARALRHAWTEAARSVAPTGEAALVVRIGIQSDLAAQGLGDWVQGFRRALPAAAFYIEPDYSAQMCRDLAEGRLDFAVMFTPHPAPDLHFETLGEAPYVMVSTRPARLAELTADRLVRANYSPAFAAAQAAVLPQVAGAPVAAGQSAAVASLIGTLGGAAYLHEGTARGLGAAVHRVADAPRIGQPVYAALHLRHRTGPLHRTLLRGVRAHFAAAPAGRAAPAAG